MTDCVYFLLYLALGKLSLMLLINYINYKNHITLFFIGVKINQIIFIDFCINSVTLKSLINYNTFCGIIIDDSLM